MNQFINPFSDPHIFNEKFQGGLMHDRSSPLVRSRDWCGGLPLNKTKRSMERGHRNIEILDYFSIFFTLICALPRQQFTFFLERLHHSRDLLEARRSLDL
jgi:hypothetical protein